MTYPTPDQADPFLNARDIDSFYDSKTGKLNNSGRTLIYEAINLLQAAAWATTESKGFHEDDRPFSEEVALIHSEVSEALESNRSGEPSLWFKTDESSENFPMDPYNEDGSPRKAEGAAAEFADIFIRCGDSAEGRAMPLAEALVFKMDYNTTRPYKHGRKY